METQKYEHDLEIPFEVHVEHDVHRIHDVVFASFNYRFGRQLYMPLNCRQH